MADRKTHRKPDPLLRFLWSAFWTAILRFFPVLLLLLAPTVALAFDPVVPTVASAVDPLPGVYRLHSRGWTAQVCRGNYCEPGHWSEYQGSCVAFDDTDKNNQWFLTVGHVLHEANQVALPSGRVPIRIRHRFTTPIDEVIFFSVPQELAGRIKVYAIADTRPKPGARAWIAGFPGNRPGTVCTTVSSPSAEGHPAILETIAHGQEGHSGGALLTLDETLGGAVLSGLVVGFDRNSERGLYLDVAWAADQLKSKLHPEPVVAPAPPAQVQPVPPATPVVELPSTLPTTPTPALPSVPAPTPAVPSTPAPALPSSSTPTPTTPSTPVNATPPAPVLALPFLPNEQPAASPSFLNTLGSAATATLPWLVPLILGTAGTGGSLAAVGAGVKVLGWALKGLKVARQVHHSGATAPGPHFPAAPTLPQRDPTEAQQILQLRQMEGRSPVHDALYGVLFQDEAESNPDSTLREALSRVNARFNSMAPLSSSAG